MAEIIPVQNLIYNKGTFTKVINTQFSELNSNPTVVPETTVDAFFELYDDIKAAGDDFLKGNKNESAICLAYEALIYFIVHEEFEKCAYLRNRLTEYSNSRTPWLNNYLESLIKI